jgi:hypothetical protein
LLGGKWIITKKVRCGVLRNNNKIAYASPSVIGVDDFVELFLSPDIIRTRKANKTTFRVRWNIELVIRIVAAQDLPQVSEGLSSRAMSHSWLSTLCRFRASSSPPQMI